MTISKDFEELQKVISNLKAELDVYKRTVNSCPTIKLLHEYLQLTKEEQDEVIQYIQFIKSKRK